MSPLFGRRTGTRLMSILPMKVYGRLLPRESIGLCYHVVSDAALPHVRHLYRYKSSAQFEADLVYLQRRYRVVTYDELVKAREDGTAAGRNLVHVSFDDGYAECFSVIRPLLLKHGVPCTFFVTTDVLDNRRMLDFNRVSLCLEAMEGMGEGEVRSVLSEIAAEGGHRMTTAAEFAVWIRRSIRDPDSGASAVLDRLCRRLEVDVAAFLRDRRPYMTSDEVRQMASEGFTIGGHTRTHRHMGTARRPEWVEEEIVVSSRIAAELSGARRVPFAFPYDAEGMEVPFMRDLLARHPDIGPLFGTAQLRPEEHFIVNRMLADSPPAKGRARSNLPGLLRGAYLEEMLRRAGSRGEVAQ
ncbi:MAG TPA: polysaccharide deacetylase family protein [Longimicrobium sp.]|nr:polysaccharide deacetylase family protein [Longimicrobium sp.]